MSQLKADPTRRSEHRDENVEQQHLGLHTPPGSGPQQNLSGRHVEADKNVTVSSKSRMEPLENSGPTSPTPVKKGGAPDDSRKGDYGAW